MRTTLISAVACFVGCAAPQGTVPASELAGPDLCPEEPRSRGPWNEEDPECWRAQFPVSECDAPVHPELVGLWGLGGSTFAGRLLYDGCCVTFYDTGLLRMRLTMGGAVEVATHGRPANVGPANRTQAVWDGETLRSDSHLGSIEVGRRISEEGRAHLTFVEQRYPERREYPLIRLGPEDCIDEPTRSLLCATLIVPGGPYPPPSSGWCRE